MNLYIFLYVAHCDVTTSIMKTNWGNKHQTISLAVTKMFFLKVVQKTLLRKIFRGTISSSKRFLFESLGHPNRSKKFFL